ncbi:hypothetical protein PRUPE_1G456400 [Prunus persica]|uniref:Uncharacterized protein n=1 Tax=Prunus persica TaxID=3760 RepID=A0A251RDB5_PRUPE|nr:hypothetical protein PRUPE_1G456400 [Prunus persica]
MPNSKLQVSISLSKFEEEFGAFFAGRQEGVEDERDFKYGKIIQNPNSMEPNKPHFEELCRVSINEWIMG